jgi:HIP---CoA ligase
VRIVGPAGDELERGRAGEIVVGGYNVMHGYYNDEAATEETIDGGGWRHTGDVGVMDADGNVTITDRLKDMYVSGGFNVYPAEVEATLRRHPGVGQVAVVGVPDARLGEVGLAVVVPAPGADAAALTGELPGWARDQMANYKVPRRAVAVDELPTNASGKVLKRDLRERYAVAP